MKILIASDYAAPSGGAEAMSRILQEGLRERGHEVRLFASTAVDANVEYSCYGTTAPWRTLLQSANPFAARALQRAIDDFRPDVVHVRMFLTQLSPLILPVLRRVPSLYHVVWYRAVCPLGTKLLPNGKACTESPGRACLSNGCLPMRDWLPLMFQRKLQKRGLDAFDSIVANSEATRLKLIAEGIPVHRVIPNGVPPREQRPPLSAPPRVVFAGRLVREKGVHILLEAFARLLKSVPTSRLIIAGDGPERSALTELASKLAVSASVECTGQITPAELDAHRAAAWVQVVPSVWDEPFGIVAAESMMSGTAVIASNSGGLADIVRCGVTGRLVEPGDVSSLANALLEIVGDREKAEAMGAEGRQIALAEFSDTICVERFLETYRALADGTATRTNRSPS